MGEVVLEESWVVEEGLLTQTLGDSRVRVGRRHVAHRARRLEELARLGLSLSLWLLQPLPLLLQRRLRRRRLQPLRCRLLLRHLRRLLLGWLLEWGRLRESLLLQLLLLEGTTTKSGGTTATSPSTTARWTTSSATSPGTIRAVKESVPKEKARSLV